MKKLLIVAGLSLTTLGAATVASADAEPGGNKVTICHATSAANNQYVTLHIDEHAVYNDQAGHFHENGTPQSGHEDDHMGACEQTTTTTTEVTTTTAEVTTTTAAATTTTTAATTTTADPTTTMATTTTVAQTTTEVDECLRDEPLSDLAIGDYEVSGDATGTTKFNILPCGPAITTPLEPSLVEGDSGTVTTTVAPVVAGDSGTELPSTGPSQTLGMALMALGFLLTGLGVVAMTRRPETEPLI